MERRRSSRLLANKEIAARAPAISIKATLLDLSVSGCKGKSSSHRIVPGATIFLRFSDIEKISGKVVWRRADLFGISFHQEISPSTITRYAASHLHETTEEPFVRDRFGRRLPVLGGRTRMCALEEFARAKSEHRPATKGGWEEGPLNSYEYKRDVITTVSLQRIFQQAISHGLE